MFKKVMLGLVLSAALCMSDLTSEAFGQSGSRGSSTRGASGRSAGGSGSSAGRGSSNRADNYAAARANAARAQARQLAQQKSRLARQIAKEDFGSIKLNRQQNQTLSRLVDINFAELARLDQQVASLIPAGRQRTLRRAYESATDEGKSETEAMKISMDKVGVSETNQTRVLELSETRTEVKNRIIKGVIATLDDTQKQTLADASEKNEEKDAEGQ